MTTDLLSNELPVHPSILVVVIIVGILATKAITLVVGWKALDGMFKVEDGQRLVILRINGDELMVG